VFISLFCVRAILVDRELIPTSESRDDCIRVLVMNEMRDFSVSSSSRCAVFPLLCAARRLSNEEDMLYEMLFEVLISRRSGCVSERVTRKKMGFFFAIRNGPN